MGEMYPDTCTAGEDVVQIKMHLSKEDREKKGWTQLVVDGRVHPGPVFVYILVTVGNVRSMTQQGSRHILA